MFSGPSDVSRVPQATFFDMYAPHPMMSMARSARLESEDSVLIVRGRVVDVVCVSQKCLDPSGQASLLQLDVTEIGELDQRLEVTKLADEDKLPVFLSSLLNVFPDNLCSEDLESLFYTVFARIPWFLPVVNQWSREETTAFHFWVYLQDWKLAKKDLDRLEHAISIVERHSSRLGGTVGKFSESNDEKKQSMQEQAMQRMESCQLGRGRVLGRTRAGRLYNSMQRIEDGDVIMALQGSRQLHVMRPCGEMFKLISDIYVNGLMFGEAYADQDPDEVDYEISIC